MGTFDKIIDEQHIADLLKEAKRQQAEFNGTVVKCGIIGTSGAGKSSLINAIAGEKIAPVGSTEQTMTAQSYLHQGTEFVDLPGYGTEKWPQASYIADLDLLHYDCFIIVTHTRLYASDVFLFRELGAKHSKPCFVVRNKIDTAIHDEAHDNGLTEQQTLLKVRSNIQSSIGTQHKVYLTSARHPAKWDLPQLMTDISQSQQGFKRDRFIAGMAAWSELALTAKRQVAYKIVSWSATLSAANGLNPIPLVNISVDAGVLINMCRQISTIYGLSEAQLAYAEKTAPNLQQSPEFRALKLGISKWLAKYAVTEGVVLALKQLGKTAVVKNVSALLPIIGSLLAAGLGYRMTTAFGEQYIQEAEQLARQVLQQVVKNTGA